VASAAFLPVSDARLVNLQRDDLPEILALMQWTQSPWSESMLKETLRSDCQYLLGLKYACRLTGLVVVQVLDDEAEILNLVVQPEVRRKGLARHMLLALFERYPGRRWFLEVRSGNRAAQHLYDSVGFVRTGIRKNYYPLGRCTRTVVT
jgi:ribosomal-protein-alanine N-acetyltransferase